MRGRDGAGGWSRRDCRTPAPGLPAQITAGTQQTLPIGIFSNIKLPHQRPIVNVAAVAVILLSIIPIYIAQRLTGTDATMQH